MSHPFSFIEHISLHSSPLLHPSRPKDLKVKRSSLIPKKGLIYDHFYRHEAFGSWESWTALVQAIDIQSQAQVGDLSTTTEPLTVAANVQPRLSNTFSSVHNLYIQLVSLFVSVNCNIWHFVYVQLFIHIHWAHEYL